MLGFAWKMNVSRSGDGFVKIHPYLNRGVLFHVQGTRDIGVTDTEGCLKQWKNTECANGVINHVTTAGDDSGRFVIRGNNCTCIHSAHRKNECVIVCRGREACDFGVNQHELAYVCGAGSVCISDTSRGIDKHQIGSLGNVHQIAWQNRGNVIATYAEHANEVVCVDPRSKGGAPSMRFTSPDTHHMALDVWGTELALIRGGNEVCVFDLRHPQEPAIKMAHSSVGNCRYTDMNICMIKHGGEVVASFNGESCCEMLTIYNDGTVTGKEFGDHVHACLSGDVVWTACGNMIEFENE